jgi:peroxiredoxin
MKNLLKLGAIVLPATLGIAVTIVVSQKIMEYRRNKPPENAARSGSLLPRAPLVNLQTNRDEYQNVTSGKVLLVFVTTDCDACRKELFNVSQAIPSLAAKVTVYGVGIEDRDSVNTFIIANHINFPILLDHGATILSRLGFKLMPTKVLLQDGAVTKIWYGSSPDKTVLIKDVGDMEAK